MPEPIHPSKLEEVMKEISNTPEPDVEFVNSLRARFIAEGYASAKKNQETQMKQKTFSRRLTWALAVLALVALVVLFTRPTVVNALKQLFGYVPNVGIIDQSSDVRMLDEPVTIVREGIRVTVEQAVLNNEKTVIVYSQKFPLIVFDLQKIHEMNRRPPVLVLPDGTRLDINFGRQTMARDCSECDFLYVMEFAPIPVNINEAVLEIPALTAVLGGLAPQDWKIQLKFKTADLAEIFPIFEYQPTPVSTMENNEALAEPSTPYGIDVVLEKFVALDDRYILYGNASWTDSKLPLFSVHANLIKIEDTNGVEIPFEYADPGVYSQDGELRQYWAYEVRNRNFVEPLRLYFSIDATLLVDGGSFLFDPGPNPQHGQTWDINQDVLVNNEIIHVISAKYEEHQFPEVGLFFFTMESDSNIVGASITDPNYELFGGGGGGGGGLPEENNPFGSGFGYQLPIPQGPLTVKFTSVNVIVPGDWTLEWSP